MNEKPAPSPQLRLTLLTQCLAEVPTEAERQLVTALADLLIAVATHGVLAKEGGGDEGVPVAVKQKTAFSCSVC